MKVFKNPYDATLRTSHTHTQARQTTMRRELCVFRKLLNAVAYIIHTYTHNLRVYTYIYIQRRPLCQ